MQPGKGVNFLLEAFVIFAVLGSLTAMSLPYIGKLVGRGHIESRSAEYHSIRTAVTAMLSESRMGTLYPVGPTADMETVKTTDQPPLVLSDFLNSAHGNLAGYNYTFSENGTVTQESP